MNKLISIIIPTFNNSERLIDILLSIDSQQYQNKEVIVVDDNSQGKSNDGGATRIVVDKLKAKLKINIMYVNTYSTEYGLAKARNMGAIAAMGDILFFFDDRYLLNNQVLDKVAIAQHGIWYFGAKRVKGNLSTKKSFIENVSWLTRNTFRRFGCFNERINMYGAMSQDIRERNSAIGIKMQMVEDMIVDEVGSSRSKSKRDQIWKAKLLLWKLNQ